jgi:cytochrome c5
VVLSILSACGSSEPKPTATPNPTYTPLPTLTPYATLTPNPTYTALPTLTPYETLTPNPTYTLLPTLTPKSTYTPLPTLTPYATLTPNPTYTLLPTLTPNSTYTPLPTLTPKSTYTPLPTLTANSTYTPYPTYTAVPPASAPTQAPLAAVGDTVEGGNWRVTVTQAETGDEFGPYYFDTGATTHFVILTLEYTYLGSERRVFTPESVVLVYTGSGLTGWTETPALYQGESYFEVTNFAESAVAFNMFSGDSRTEQFAYDFPIPYTDFVLLFPGLPGIVIDLDAASGPSALVTVEPSPTATVEATEEPPPTATAEPTEESSPGASGEVLFANACAKCHGETDGVGPALPGMGRRAATRIVGLTARDYLRQSIVNPSIYVVEGFKDLMPKTFGIVFSAAEIDGLVEYLLEQ